MKSKGPGKGNEAKPKVSEIARKAGVSTSTVSKVINGRPGVSSTTRHRVERFLAEAGYRKPLVTTKTSSTIELVVKAVENNGTVEMIRYTTDYARELGIGITVSCTGRAEQDHALRKGIGECLRGAIDRNPLGVILLLSDITPDEEKLLTSRNIPYVIIDPIGQVAADTLGVGIDNWTSGLIATEHLTSFGHRRIGAITGPAEAQSSQARYSGFVTALHRVGVDADPALVKAGDYQPDKAFKAACELLDMPKDKRPSAIFAFNDLSAVSVYRAAHQRGIRIPEDLSVVGFDNVYPSAYLYPALTTITQPFRLIARRAIDLIYDARGERVMQHYQILPTQLEVRDSCAPPAV